MIGPATETVAELLVEVGKEQPAISVEKGSTIQGRVMATKHRSSGFLGNLSQRVR